MAAAQASKKDFIAVLPNSSGCRESVHKTARRGQLCRAQLNVVEEAFRIG
jgi:hypothetical protein